MMSVSDKKIITKNHFRISTYYLTNLDWLICKIILLLFIVQSKDATGSTLYGGNQWQHQQNIQPQSDLDYRIPYHHRSRHLLAPIVCNGSQLDYEKILRHKNLIDENCKLYRTAAYEASLDYVQNKYINNGRGDDYDPYSYQEQIPAICFYLDQDMNIMINRNFDCETALTSTGTNSIFAININSPEIEFNHDVHEINKSPKEKANVHGSVVLIPGLAASRLQAKLDNVEKVNFLCSRNSDWSDVWLRLSLLFPLKIDCWIENIILDYDLNTHTTQDRPGVQIRTADFGSVRSVEHLDLKHTNRSAYFAPIINRLTRLGYVKDKTIHAAPYDFRKAPNELDEYFRKLERLIERAVALGYGHPTTLICHSMGCLNVLVFLRQRSVKWRKHYIHRLIALAAPWGGSIKAVKALVSGDNLDMPFVSETKLREAVRSFPSIPLLLPNMQALDPTTPDVEILKHVLIQTPNKNYTAADYERLFNDLDLPIVLDMWRTTKDLVKPLDLIEELRVDCIHGSGIATIDTVRYLHQSDFPNGPYQLKYDDGDGTVNTASLTICSKWQKQSPELIKHIVLPNINHGGVLYSDDVLDYITSKMLETP